MAVNTWTNVLVKVRGQLGWLVGANLAFSVVTPVLALVGAGYGPSGVGAAWGLGNLLCGCVAGAALLVGAPTAASPTGAEGVATGGDVMADGAPSAVRGNAR